MEFAGGFSRAYEGSMEIGKAESLSTLNATHLKERVSAGNV
jgi:hypothetical protein